MHQTLRSKSLLIHVCVLGGLILWGCPNAVRSAENTVPVQERPKVKAPLFQIKDLNGKIISLEKLKGKVVFLDFWATWCPPCIIASSYVDEMALEFKKKDVVVLSVSLDMYEESVRAFLKDKTPAAIICLAGNSGIDYQYRISGIPAFFLIDKEGFVRRYWGGFNPRYPSIWRDEINLLLKP